MDRDAGRILAALQNAQEQMSKINIIIVDFTFLVHMHGKELLEWLASLASSKHCKVLVCDEFLSNYELFQKSESPKQREIAVGVNNFINMLSQNRVLVLDERFRTIEHLIYKLQARSDVALFLANNSEADEVLRSCSCPRMMIVSYMTNGSLFCSSAIDYINSTQQMLLLENNDLATVLVPDFPEINSSENQLENEKAQLENTKAELDKPFVHEEELKTKSARLAELNAMLDLNKKDNEIVDGEREEEEPSEPSRDDRDAR